MRAPGRGNAAFAASHADGARTIQIMPTDAHNEARPWEVRNVLITGAAGRLGSVLRVGLRDGFRLNLTDREPLPTPAIGSEEFHRVELENAEALEPVMRGADAVVHLGGVLRETAPWGSILSANIAGTYHVFEIARTVARTAKIKAQAGDAVLREPRTHPAVRAVERRERDSRYCRR